CYPLRTASRMALKLRNLILRRHLHVGEQLESRTAQRHASLGAEELQAFARAASAAGFPVRPERREAGIFEQGVLGIRRLAVVGQREAATRGSDGLRRSRL